jgi:hypothetical protein
MLRYLITTVALVGATLLALGDTGVSVFANPVVAPPAPAPTGSASTTPSAVATAPPAPLPSGARDVTVPGGTVVEVVVTDPVSSASAKVGDTFGIKATADVVIDGYVVIAKGAGGQGEVLAVERAGSHGHPGTLGIQVDWVYALSGDKVRLTSQRKTSEGQNETGVSSTMTIASYLLLGPVGLFAHNWVKGHDIVLDSTHTLETYVDNTVHIVSATQSDASAGFAH